MIHELNFVAFCSFFPCSLTVVHSNWSTGVDNEKVGVDNEKALELDNRIFFIFQLNFNREISPKNCNVKDFLKIRQPEMSGWIQAAMQQNTISRD